MLHVPLETLHRLPTRRGVSSKVAGQSQEEIVWEVFVRPKNGLGHKHCGSVHACDKDMALLAARDVYTRRGEGDSIWVVRSIDVVSSNPKGKEENFAASGEKNYRYPAFYDVPDDVENI